MESGEAKFMSFGEGEQIEAFIGNFVITRVAVENLNDNLHKNLLRE